ncbi:hypothetical protein [Providencia alcalifaciens]|uniref:hypothetical protein n=1 Tax=Providencia alcalifaciens TaxID=126385 RepID=UPI0032DB594A
MADTLKELLEFAKGLEKIGVTDGDVVKRIEARIKAKKVKSNRPKAKFNKPKAKFNKPKDSDHLTR